MSWQNSPILNKLTASQQGGNRGAQLWGVDFKGTLHTIYQTTPGGQWSAWLGPDWNGPNHPKQVYELAAAQRQDGTMQLWVLDMKRQLWTTWQTVPVVTGHRGSQIGIDRRVVSSSRRLPPRSCKQLRVNRRDFGVSQRMEFSRPVPKPCRQGTGAGGAIGPRHRRSLVGLKSRRANRVTVRARCGASTPRDSFGAWARSHPAATGQISGPAQTG